MHRPQFWTPRQSLFVPDAGFEGAGVVCCACKWQVPLVLGAVAGSAAQMQQPPVATPGVNPY